MPDTYAAPCEALPTADGPAPAAALSAGIVRRGHNPWWDKDQKTPAPANPKAEDAAKIDPVLDATRRKLTRARIMLDREDSPAQGPAAPSIVRAHLPPRPDTGPGLFERLPMQMLADAAVFVAVFTVSCGLMLYLSPYAF
jgi:hypothetical protein